MKKAVLAPLLLSVLLCGCNSNTDVTTEPTPWIPVTSPEVDVNTETAPPLFVEEDTTYNPFDDFGNWFNGSIELPEEEA